MANPVGESNGKVCGKLQSLEMIIQQHLGCDER